MSRLKNKIAVVTAAGQGIGRATAQPPSLDERLAATGDAAKARAELVSRQPMGRIAKAEEIAQLALYLASDASAFTTGATHIIDGGWSNGWSRRFALALDRFSSPSRRRVPTAPGWRWNGFFACRITPTVKLAG